VRADAQPLVLPGAAEGPQRVAVSSWLTRAANHGVSTEVERAVLFYPHAHPERHQFGIGVREMPSGIAADACPKSFNERDYSAPNALRAAASGSP
jgi:hypothetical protein